MGGRGSGGGKGGRGAGGGGGLSKGTLDNKKQEDIKAKTEAKKKVEEKPKEKTLQEKRLEALAKARAKRAENLKNGIKPEKKEKDPRRTKPKMSMDSTVSDLKYNLRRNVDTDGYISNSDFRVEDYGSSISLSVRDLGKWKNPSHARYEEDYDWQVLKKSSGKQIDKVIKKMAKQSGRKITWSASEKNWIDIDIPKMKGD